MLSYPGRVKWDDRGLTVVLVLAMLGCGGWVAWPHLSPVAVAPQVTRTALEAPALQAPAGAVEYGTTGSVEPLISGRLNLNTASREQLEALPRIGPALAQRIMDGRPYRSLEDLDRVKGIGPKLLLVLEPLVTW